MRCVLMLLMHAGLSGCTTADFVAAQLSNRITLLPTFEGGDQLDGSIENLHLAYPLGMVVDLSHAAETVALQAMNVSNAPVIFLSGNV